MRKTKEHLNIIAMQREVYDDMLLHCRGLGSGGHYTEEQIDYVFDTVREYGIRATSRILRIPRRTIQRWREKRWVYIKRCPDWVFSWAEKRRRRRAFWERRGYYYK